MATYSRHSTDLFSKTLIRSAKHLVYERVTESFNRFLNADSFRKETLLLCVALKRRAQFCLKTMLILKVQAYEIATIPQLPYRVKISMLTECTVSLIITAEIQCSHTPLV